MPLAADVAADWLSLPRTKPGQAQPSGLARLDLSEHYSVEFQALHRVHHALGSEDLRGKVGEPEHVQVLRERSGIEPVHGWETDLGATAYGARRLAAWGQAVRVQLSVNRKLQFP